MCFPERHLHAISSTDLRDDTFHHHPETLRASAFAEPVARGLGSLLTRVKCGGTIIQKLSKALLEKSRFEQLLAAAERRNDKKKADEFRRELESNLCACTVSGSEANAFRSLSRAWLEIVTEKGAARNWIKPQDVPAIGHLAPALYERVAAASLAYYLDGKCPTCHGSKVGEDRRKCQPCDGTGDAKILGMSDFEKGRVLDMVSELMALESSHSGAASMLLRREG